MTTDRIKASWNIENIKRRVARAMRFPENTDPSSRHARMIGEDLAGKKGHLYAMALAESADEREHIATSILVTVEMLYKARNEIERLKGRK